MGWVPLRMLERFPYIHGSTQSSHNCGDGHSQGRFRSVQHIVVVVVFIKGKKSFVALLIHALHAARI